MAAVKPAATWTPSEVAAWLAGAGWGVHGPDFLDHNVDGAQLVAMTEERLIADFGMDGKTYRKALLSRIRSLLPEDPGVDADQDDLTCLICMDILTSPVVAACGHVFCSPCLERWLGRNSTCPIDRRALPAAVPPMAPHVDAFVQRAAAALGVVRRQASAAPDPEATRMAEAEAARRAAEERERAAKITRVRRAFGGGAQLDASALEAVLEMSGGDVDAAIRFMPCFCLDASCAAYALTGSRFLQLEGEAPADLVTLEDLASANAGVPKDFRKNPATMRPLPPRAAPGGILQAMRRCLIGDAMYADHLDAQTHTRAAYVGTLKALLARNVELPQAAKTRMLAACWARRDTALCEFLLNGEPGRLFVYKDGCADLIGVAEMLKAIRLLDSPRQIRAKQKRIARLTAQGTCKARKLGQLRSDITDLQREAVPHGSLSGALTKYIRKLVLRIPAPKLEFFALQLPTEPWRELADLLHLPPNTGTQVPWFLPRAFGVAPPADAIVVTCADLSAANVTDILTARTAPYSFIRTKVPVLPLAARALVARQAPVDQVLWWYEDLCSPEVDAILAARLDAGEQPVLGYGKLMERLMYFRGAATGAPVFERLLPIAEARLRTMRLPLEPPVVVIGDASYSMDVAIRTSLIIGSVLAVMTRAEMQFFNSVAFRPPVVPATAQQAIEVASATRADGQTAAAAALWEYYEAKTRVNVFVVVTDERENAKFRGHYFHQLFYKYYTEVHPAKLVFVSFLEPNAEGPMVAALRELGITPMQFRLDGRRPDLTKFDGLVGEISAETGMLETEMAASVAAVTAEMMASAPAAAAAAAKKKKEAAPAAATEAPAADAAPAAAAAAPASAAP